MCVSSVPLLTAVVKAHAVLANVISSSVTKSVSQSPAAKSKATRVLNQWRGCHLQVVGGVGPARAILDQEAVVCAQVRGEASHVTVGLRSRGVETGDWPLIGRDHPGAPVSPPLGPVRGVARLALHVRPRAGRGPAFGQGSVRVQGGDAHLVGGLGPGQDPVGLQGMALLRTQAGAPVFALKIACPVPPGPVLIVVPLDQVLVLVRVSLLLLPQTAQRLGPLPGRGAALPQGVGARHREAAQVREHRGDVVPVSDEAPTYDRLKRKYLCVSKSCFPSAESAEDTGISNIREHYCSLDYSFWFSVWQGLKIKLWQAAITLHINGSPSAMKAAYTNLLAKRVLFSSDLQISLLF